VTHRTAKWPLFTAIPVINPGPTAVVYGYVMQFDIIGKDTIAAPKTGWVFATLVYDARAKGNDAWDKMVSLGPCGVMARRQTRLSNLHRP
jgi:hypothetical protein